MRRQRLPGVYPHVIFQPRPSNSTSLVDSHVPRTTPFRRSSSSLAYDKECDEGGGAFAHPYVCHYTYTRCRHTLGGLNRVEGVVLFAVPVTQFFTLLRTRAHGRPGFRGYNFITSDGTWYPRICRVTRSFAPTALMRSCCI